MVLHIQNVVDVITNSSSELFIINNPNGLGLQEIIDSCVKKLDDKYEEKYLSMEDGLKYLPNVERELQDYYWYKDILANDNRPFRDFSDAEVVEGSELTNIELAIKITEHLEGLVMKPYREILSRGNGCTEEQVRELLPKGFEEDFEIFFVSDEDLKMEHYGDEEWYNLREIKEQSKRARFFFFPEDLEYESETKPCKEFFPERYHEFVDHFNKIERERQEKEGRVLRVYYSDNLYPYFSTILNQWEHGYTSTMEL